MNEPDASPRHGPEPDPQRRALLTGLTASCLASYVPSALAQNGDAAAREAFMTVSLFLTGRASLDVDHAGRLYDALVADAASFATDVQALRSFIHDRKVDPTRLQQALDAEHSALAGAPRTIVKAWYTGVVGEADQARCIAFETSLMYATVADRLHPPSYCYGGYGSWMEKPA